MVGARVGVSIDVGIAREVGTDDGKDRNALLLPPPNGLDGAVVGVGLLRSANKENPQNSVPSVIAVFLLLFFVAYFTFTRKKLATLL